MGDYRMNSRTAVLMAASALCLVGCGHRSAPTYTLYRTSSMDRSARVHWGTFDAHESDPSYNQANCEMAARLLNANMKALSGSNYNPRLGFWCEAGGYRESGDFPASFGAAFPTDV